LYGIIAHEFTSDKTDVNSVWRLVISIHIFFPK